MILASQVLIVLFSKQRTSNRQNTCNQYEAAGDQQDSVYENVPAAQDIYCNDFYR